MTKPEYIKIQKLINNLETQRLDFYGLSNYTMICIDKKAVLNILEVFVEDKEEK